MNLLRKFAVGIASGIHRITMIGMPKGRGWFTRYSMYRDIRSVFAAAPIKPNPRVLAISFSRHLAKLVVDGPCEIVEANYPEVDILRLPFSDEEFDLVVSDQVLEHVQGDPQDAINETLRVTKANGRIVHTTCFLTPYHGPGDYWRFSPEGLAHLCRHITVERASGWGNGFVPIVNALGLGKSAVPDVRWHPFHWLATVNRPSYVYMVWVVATNSAQNGGARD